jgi:hypothetical protein
MRAALTLLAVSLTFSTACKKDGGGGDAIAKMTELKDKMCACKDKTCADQVTQEMTKWGADHKAGEASKLGAEDQKKLAGVTGDMTTCLTKIMTAAGSAAAGSAAAGSAAAGSAAAGAAGGSGSDAGSAAGAGSAAAAGSDAAAAEAMAHRAGMCPSTVLGATTTAQIKGKAVVVTVESTDKDAIAAIQKRADKLVAEKKTGAGSAHDQKGTHGGGQGLCPVYVPEGAKARAKHESKGVIVTITPKTKPDELAREIDGRIAKAADWVKANVKAGDQQNQGGVGGGKGDDGSNHSGKGDGKGHERKAGGGGGAGTGGGGAAGDGGGSAKGGW